MAKSLTMEQFWDWSKVETINGAGDLFTGPDRCTYFEKELWFELIKGMWRKQRITFQDHVKYIHNDIVKPFRFIILRYVECIREINYLDKYLPPPLMKDGDYDEADWSVRDKELSEHDICVAIRYGIPTYM